MSGFIMAIVLVPALVLMRRGMEVSRKIETYNMLHTLCVAKLEEHLTLGTADFTEATSSGDFTADGYSDLRFTVDRSTDGADGGIADQLMAVVATVWHDEDGDDTKDADEPSVTLGSKIAKMLVYEDEASGS